IPGPEHTDDEIVAEDQLDTKDASPTAQSLDYVLESDPEADPEEDDNKDLEEDPVDYSADGGVNGEDEDEPSEEDEDDDVDMEADGDEEEDEHLVPAESVVVALPASDQAPSAKEDRLVGRDTFETRVRQDTDEVYTRLDDEQSQRQLLAGRLNMLFRDRRAHAYTRHQIETEARLSREAWRRSMDVSDLACGEEIGYDFRDAEGRPEEIYRDERVEDN
ncbi:hypothetical protein Tco_0108516, partial [Tanacetum coccineum]